MPGTDGNGNGHLGEDRPAAIARAWKLATVDGMSSRQIARALGVSQPTAREYVRLGREAEGHVHLYDRAVRREMSVVALDWWKAQVVSQYEAGALILEKALPLYLAADKQSAERQGLNMPTRISVEHEGAPDGVDPEVLAAVAATQRQAHEEQLAIERKYAQEDGRDGEGLDGGDGSAVGDD